MDYVEEAIARERPFEEVCRLIALASQIMNGIKPKTYDLLRHEIIQTYGFERLAALQNLERSRLIRKTDANDQPAYTTNLRKSLRLTVDDVDEHNPKDAAYVYSGYAPITARLVELAFRRPDLVVSKQQSIGSNKRLPTWRGNEDVLKLVAGGPAFEWEPKAQDSSATQQASEGQRKVILVVFVGGCTYAEISALRFLSHQSKGAHQFVVITTDLLSSPRLIKSMEAEPI